MDAKSHRHKEEMETDYLQQMEKVVYSAIFPLCLFASSIVLVICLLKLTVTSLIRAILICAH